MVPVGFLVANPFAILDYKNFIADFMYNNLTAPVYLGETGSTNYLNVGALVAQVVGVPGLLLCIAALLFAVWQLFRLPRARKEFKSVVLAFSVLLPYYLVMGSFPRLPVRFIVPAVPLCIVLSGLLWNRLRHRKILVLALLLAIVPYSLLCSCYVGVRFLGDPRMEAQLWVDENLPPGSSIESTPYTPRWSLVGRDDIEEIRSPFLTGRKKIFETIWGDNPWVRRKLYYEGHDEEWYAVDELLARDPDYVAVDSLYFDRFTDEDTIVADYYPSVAVFFRDLLVEDYPYTIVFDRESEDVPTWIYPKEIDFLHNRIVILRKRNPSE
jgi:hypothetical protein